MLKLNWPDETQNRASDEVSNQVENQEHHPHDTDSDPAHQVNDVKLAEAEVAEGSCGLAQVDHAVLQRFTLWAVQHLHLPLQEESPGIHLLEIPEEAVSHFDDSHHVRFTFDKERFDSSDLDDLELITPGGRLLKWLIDQVRALGNVAHAQPKENAKSVSDITEHFFTSYTVDDGNIHLAGCTLEDRPVLRLTLRLRLESLEPRDELIELFITGDGQEISSQVAHDLGFDSLRTISKVPRTSEAEIQRLVDRAMQLGEQHRHSAQARLVEQLSKRLEQEEAQLRDYFNKTIDELASQLEEQLAEQEQQAVQEQMDAMRDGMRRRLESLKERFAVRSEINLVAATLIWCRYAAGKLRFSIGTSTAETPFQGWASLVQPPPFRCPYSGVETYHLATTSDGRIAAFESLATCEESGERALSTELVQCSYTGKVLLPRYCEICPITHEYVMRDVMVTCPTCRQQVSPQAKKGKSCAACRSLKSVNKAEPRMARILDEHRGLDKWRSWRISETENAYILQASGLWQLLLVVLDKATLEPYHLAWGNRLKSGWTSIDESRYAEILQ